MSRIDPIRRGDLLRRSVQRDTEEAQAPSEADVVRLPVPVEQVSRILPRGEKRGREAAFAAQLMGQEGAKRGLRAGPELFDSAKDVYNRTEWSGAKDRRAPAGGKARTDI